MNLYGLEMPEKLTDNTAQRLVAFPLFYTQPPPQTVCETRKRKQNHTLPSKENVPLVQKFARKNFQKEDESSWCDVSEMSTTTFASGDALLDRKSMLLDELTVSKMVDLIKKLQKENQDIYKRVLRDGIYKDFEQGGDSNKQIFW